MLEAMDMLTTPRKADLLCQGLEDSKSLTPTRVSTFFACK
jgi:hypothetical protein